MSLFCRHNRFMAECPICSKGTVLDPQRRAAARKPAAAKPAARRGGGRPKPPAGARVTVGPHASTGPYETDAGALREVRLERVPGGLRLGSWSRGSLERAAPVLGALDVAELVRSAWEREVVSGRDAELLRRALEAEAGEPAEPGACGTSVGRSGELREELRFELLPGDEVRVARWLYRPGSDEWLLQDAAPMLPAGRYAEALAAAIRRGVVPV